MYLYVVRYIYIYMYVDALAITARRHNGGSFGWGGDVHPPEAIMEGPQTIDGIPGELTDMYLRNSLL